MKIMDYQIQQLVQAGLDNGSLDILDEDGKKFVAIKKTGKKIIEVEKA